VAEAEVGIRMTLKDRVATAKGLQEVSDGLDDVGRSAGRAEKSAKRGGGVLSKLGKGSLGLLKKTAIGATAAVAGLAAGSLWKGFNRLQGIDQARAKLTGLGHSTKSVDKIMDNALKSVEGTAFGLDAAATTAAGAVAAGVKPGKDLERTLTIVGDAASIAGTDMDAMGSIFNKVAAADMIQGDVLAQLGDAGIPILQMLSEELGVTAAEVRDMASKGKIDFNTFQNAMEGGVGGAAKASGKTFAGSMANMQAALGRLGAKVLGGVFAKMPALFGAIGGGLDKLGPVATRVGEAIGVGFTRVGEVVQKVASYFTSGGGKGLLGSLLATASAVGAQVMPVVQRLADLFVTRVLPAVGDVARTVVANVLPILKTLASTFTSTILPAVQALIGWVADRLVPVFSMVWDILKNQVLPILSDLYQWLYGSLVPAIVRIGEAVAKNLAPVFEQLVETFKTSVLPTVRDLLERFKEWMPTIKKVIGVVVRVVGAVLKLAAAILGKVLPPLIRFSGFIIRKVVPVIADLIGFVVRIVKRVIQFGGALVRTGKRVARFGKAMVNLVREGISMVIDSITKLPGKIRALGGRMLDAGKAIIGKFVDGMKNAAGIVSGIAGNVWDSLKGLLNGAIGKINSSLEFKIKLPAGKSITIDPPDIPMLERGGPVEAGRPYIVGEKRPELFVPRTDGQILPRVPEADSFPTPNSDTGDAVVVNLLLDGEQIYSAMVNRHGDLAALA
jgi:tape measure domain-containing protein